MAGIKSLFKDTAIYGLSSIVGRFLNWCLVPMYTYCFAAAEYGIVTNLYAYVALTLIILTYGMETGFFRFANHERWRDPGQVYTTTLLSLGASSALFIIAGCLLSPSIARWLECPGHPSFIWMMVIAVGVDAYTSVPFAYLRYKSRPVRFATLKLVNIGANIAFNLFFILLCPVIWQHSPEWIAWFYDPSFGVGYIFLANLISSLVTLLLVIPEIFAENYNFNGRLLREMLRYSFPLLIIGIAGIMNQTIDKILYPHLVPDSARAMYELGIYGANYKIAVILLVFLQAFRFAYEPFIFSRNKEDGAGKMQAYRDAMKYFVVFALFIFLGVMFYLDIIRYFISPAYFSGLAVVPVVMLAELFFGIFFNLSVWYKLIDRTVWGMWFSLLGLAVTIVLNVVLVPVIGYMGCAVGALCSYGTMMVASYFVGLRKYPIGYPVGRILAYFGFAALLYAAGVYGVGALGAGDIVAGLLRAVLLVVFVLVFVRREGISLKALAGPIASKLRRR